MKKADLYSLKIESANTQTSVDDFLKAQKKLTKSVKRGIKKALKKEGLSSKFAYAAKRVEDHARTVFIYATDEAASVIRALPHVDLLERSYVAVYPAQKKL